ncbi:MAG: glycine zipper 2TM domain-containing protein [Gammaproteobacteria bacterium]|nr:glycine zipper 2TM domain-containing protein [Gammaproteobacteria bacterium]MDH5591893.1 glycine zipper 2TM domain-containing protein [Gammaproteobacteria bacterium]
MKQALIIVSLITTLSLSSTALLADNKHHRNHKYDDTARVTHVEPVYSTVRASNQDNDCKDRYSRKMTTPRQYDSYTATIAGGIIGGVIGSQFGKGNGKTAMIVAGTLLGGSIGRDLDNQHQPSYHYDHQNQYHAKRYSREQHHIDGYRVTYRYHGQNYTTYMNHHPGKWIPVELSVRPANRNRYF